MEITKIKSISKWIDVILWLLCTQPATNAYWEHLSLKIWSQQYSIWFGKKFHFSLSLSLHFSSEMCVRCGTLSSEASTAKLNENLNVINYLFDDIELTSAAQQYLSISNSIDSAGNRELDGNELSNISQRYMYSNRPRIVRTIPMHKLNVCYRKNLITFIKHTTSLRRTFTKNPIMNGCDEINIVVLCTRTIQFTHLPTAQLRCAMRDRMMSIYIESEFEQRFAMAVTHSTESKKRERQKCI